VGAELRAALLTTAALLLASCASGVRQGDRAFTARDYATAIPAYERALAAEPAPATRDAVRFRLALSYVAAGGNGPEADRGRALLAELAASPPSAYRDAATFILGLQTSATGAQSAADACNGRLTDLEAEVRKLHEASKAQDDALTRLRAFLADAQVQLHHTQDELRRLKEIDLHGKR
jgi:uncharacterized coiled-coil protein SlyX